MEVGFLLTENMLKPTFTTDKRILMVNRHEFDGSIVLSIGEIKEDPALMELTSMPISSKEEFCALIGELYRMWDIAQASKTTQSL